RRPRLRRRVERPRPRPPLRGRDRARGREDREAGAPPRHRRGPGLLTAMDANPALGVTLHAVGGLAAASFYIPYKGVKAWSWETYWIVGGVFSWIVAPWAFSLGPPAADAGDHPRHRRPHPGLDVLLRRALGRGRPDLRPHHALP